MAKKLGDEERGEAEEGKGIRRESRRGSEGKRRGWTAKRGGTGKLLRRGDGGVAREDVEWQG